MPETPDPIPTGYLRSLIKGAEITQGEAARILHVDPVTVRRWLLDEGPNSRAAPWAVELLRLKLNLQRKSQKIT